MNKVKIGDKIKITKLGNMNMEYEPHLKIGDILTVSTVYNNYFCVQNPRTHGSFSIIHSEYINLRSISPKNDIEWLDRIQQNFKEQ